MKRKIILCFLFLMLIFSLAGCGGVKDWFEEKTSSSERPSSPPPICDKHVDEDDDGYCDVCGMADGSHFASNWDI